MRRSEAMLMVAVLEAAYPSAKIGDPTKLLYVEFLEPYPTDLVERAVKTLIRTEDSSFFPTIARILSYVDAERKRQPAHPELEEGELIPAPPEAIEAMRELAESTQARGGEFDGEG